VDLLRWVLDTERNVVFEGDRSGERVKTAVTYVCSVFMFGSVCH